MNRGFTVVELLITLIVIGILLGLGTVGLRATLANGRDAERKSDVETIARGLEMRYNNGNAKQALPAYDGVYWIDPDRRSKGYYPSTNEFIHTQGQQRGGFNPETVPGGYIPENLPGASNAALTSPSGIKVGQMCVWMCTPAETDSQIQQIFGAPSNIQDKYIYEAVNSGGGICSDSQCVAFNLYWISETDTTVYKGIPGLKVVRSKHQ